MQTIIGSGGAIGIPLAKALKKYTDHIRLVSRTPKKVNETDELFPIDVNDLSQIDKAVAGSETVYVVIGFEYKLSVWQNIWPPFMKEVINACKKHHAKLVFFDNVYMYNRSAIPLMTEASPIHAPSKKGAVRQQLHEMIMNEVEKGSLTALIARSADFYGPDNKNSALNMMVVDQLLKGKKAQALGDPDKVHTYTFTPDAAEATALLGNTNDAYNQVWHVPTTKEKLTNRQWIQLVADELKVEAKIQTVPVWLIRILGLFMPVMKELPEMNYQYEQDYIFDSSKFEKRFGITATAPKDGIRMLVENLKTSKGLQR
ncbi:NAD-dependent epimerase/dehydratase family protein [Chryseobacterium gotjawalense]|uniref:NAD-dependent epimerase/dehydratase family protein n=1 Tax=Chryseobacterium gotjawalense TaxID=3042315 RepID=A0ABY8RE35_9FLAO|nr:NAD-dependent epimerase/dehydratase family protein [Chryseobacterium sp. wdc7]WHF51492.1 NAD-dependent epimerase/dehydratase family protein [Chryseobacterium sp. wdc7]